MPKKKTKTTTTTRKDPYNEIDHIRDDIDSLRTNVVALTKTVKDDMKGQAITSYERLKKRSGKAVDRFEGDIKANPLKSLAFAFGTGLLLSAVLKRG